MADTKVSTFERAYIVGGIEQDFRSDGRSCQDYRHFEVETGIVSNTSGSARLRLVIGFFLPCYISSAGKNACGALPKLKLNFMHNFKDLHCIVNYDTRHLFAVGDLLTPERPKVITPFSIVLTY